MFAIEEGITIPQKYKYRHAGRKYPWESMRIGDSILVSMDDYQSVRSCQNAAITSARLRGFVVTTRKMPDGVRVWMVERPD